MEFIVNGMHCSACSARVEKITSRISGVMSCNVSLVNKKMVVEGNFSVKDVCKAIKDAGFEAIPIKEEISNKTTKIKEDANDTLSQKIKLIVSTILLAILVFCSMILPKVIGTNILQNITENHLLYIFEAVICFIILVINQSVLLNGLKSLYHKSPDMNSLIAIGSISAFISTTIQLGISIYNSFISADVMSTISVNNIYFESAAMILVFTGIGKYVESRTEAKAVSAIDDLMKLSPSKATLYDEITKAEKEVKAEDLKLDDLFIIKPGERIPTDGILIKGNSTVDESIITGESMPIEKSIGSKVIAGTINLYGSAICRVTKTGNETLLAEIIKLMNNISLTKAPIARIADKISGIFVPIVISIAILTIVIWLIIDVHNIYQAINFGISVLVVSCPCALGLATPISIVVANGLAAKKGILFKTAEALENLGKVKNIAFDKTGTITQGKPSVVNILPNKKAIYDTFSEILESPTFGDSGNNSKVKKILSSIDNDTDNSINEDNELQSAFMNLVCSLEKHSEHPLGKAVISQMTKFELEDTDLLDIEKFLAIPGKGIKGTLCGSILFVGTKRFIIEETNLGDIEISKLEAEFKLTHQNMIYVASSKRLLGYIVLIDELKNDSKQAIDELSKLKITASIVTGDNDKTATYIGNQINLPPQNIYSNLLPNDKVNIIQKLKCQGLTAMVGDGVNDAPSLAAADIGISVGGASDITSKSAKVALMSSSIQDLIKAIKISRITNQNIKQNLFWAFSYNIIGIPLAAGVLYRSFGLILSPGFAALAMSFSSVLVVCNAVRIKYCRGL